MRIAFLSDIHANLPALRAALAAAELQGARRVVVAGDIVGDGPHPAEVVRRLRERGVEAIRGNVDRQVLELGTREKKLQKKRGGKGKQKRNRAWTALQLLADAGEREWLDALPAEHSFAGGDAGVLVVHGSPHGDTDYIYSSLTPEGLRNKLQPVQGEAPRVLVSGHSHVPFARVVDGTWVVNCGSVGRPADGDPRGSFAVVDFGTEGLRAGIMRFTYPVQETMADLEAREVPGIDPEEYRLGVKR